MKKDYIQFLLTEKQSDLLINTVDTYIKDYGHKRFVQKVKDLKESLIKQKKDYESILKAKYDEEHREMQKHGKYII